MKMRRMKMSKFRLSLDFSSSMTVAQWVEEEIARKIDDLCAELQMSIDLEKDTEYFEKVLKAISKADITLVRVRKGEF